MAEDSSLPPGESVVEAPSQRLDDSSDARSGDAWVTPPMTVGGFTLATVGILGGAIATGRLILLGIKNRGVVNETHVAFLLVFAGLLTIAGCCSRQVPRPR